MDRILLFFSNDRQDPLPALTEEDDALHRILARREQKNHFRLTRESFASISLVAERLQQYQEEVALFHYGGHTGPDTLRLREEAASYWKKPETCSLPNLGKIILILFV